jgi:BMFP domain-containing protein YqiC
MFDPKLAEEVTAKFSALLAASPVRDIEKNLRAVIVGKLAELNLVTREEFDIQCELLARADARIAALEARVAELDAQRDGGSA